MSLVINAIPVLWRCVGWVMSDVSVLVTKESLFLYTIIMTQMWILCWSLSQHVNTIQFLFPYKTFTKIAFVSEIVSCFVWVYRKPKIAFVAFRWYENGFRWIWNAFLWENEGVSFLLDRYLETKLCLYNNSTDKWLYTIETASPIMICYINDSCIFFFRRVFMVEIRC